MPIGERRRLEHNPIIEDPRRYVNAAEINYTLLAAAASKAGVKLGDFCTVHSLRTRLTVYAIVGDSGNRSGAEGSLALLQRLGYDVKDGRSRGEDKKQIVERYFGETNPDKLFFYQTELEIRARSLDLDTDFSDYHAGDPGKLVFDVVASALREREFGLNCFRDTGKAPCGVFGADARSRGRTSITN